VLTVGIIFLNFPMKTTFFGFDDNAFVTTVYAQSDLSSLSPEEIREQAKDFLSTLMEALPMNLRLMKTSITLAPVGQI
jgi:hypothetical protein